jgi:hypothetical protein
MKTAVKTLFLASLLTACDTPEQMDTRRTMRPLMQDLNKIQDDYHMGYVVMNAKARDSVELAAYNKHCITWPDSLQSQTSFDATLNHVTVTQNGTATTYNY